MNELCVSCHYARMRDDVCGIYCTGGFVESNGKCRHYKDCEEEWEETGSTREEIVTALRCCASNKCGGCLFCNDDSSCISKMTDEAADLIENQQREIDALRQANEGLRFNLAAYANGERAVEDASPYAVTTDSADVGGGVPDAPDGDEICRAALETFGEAAQITMIFEEMAELQNVLCKFLRGRVDASTSTHIAEEITDVEIMLRQMVILFDCKEVVDKYRRYKPERLAAYGGRESAGRRLIYVRHR